MGGLRGGFDRTLETIELKVIELFGIVTEDLPAATQALVGDRSDSDVARMLAEREHVVDALYVEAEELACRGILLQAPVASDLRFLLSVLRIVPELERSHDLVVEIAGRAARIDRESLSPRSRELAMRAGDLASGMWRQTADAWYTRDRTAGPALSESQRQLGDLHASLTADLASGQTSMPVTMEMTQVARCYERLGAHAVNIGRRVTYLAGPTAR